MKYLDHLRIPDSDCCGRCDQTRIVTIEMSGKSFYNIEPSVSGTMQDIPDEAISSKKRGKGITVQVVVDLKRARNLLYDMQEIGEIWSGPGVDPYCRDDGRALRRDVHRNYDRIRCIGQEGGR